MKHLAPAVRAALARDETIDIVTTGRRSGRSLRTEIWFRRLDGRIYITGTPGPRDWYANLLAEPRFRFILKESLQADLAATARPVSEPLERRRILASPVMRWYHEQVDSLELLFSGSPLIEVRFDP